MNEIVTQEDRPKPPLVQFKADLSRLKDAGELDMLPANVSYEAFRNAAVVAITDNPAILQCNRESVFKAIRRLAAAGLVPDGREAAIVPFKGSAQAMPMVYGLLKVARNSGEISSIWAEVVMGDETFEISMIDGERKFQHTYDPLSRSGEVKGAYAVAKLKDGTIEIEAMGRDQIEKRRKASANQRSEGPSGIWQQWYDEMAKKTVIRALVKRLPMSSEDMRRVMIEDEDNSIRDVTPEDKPRGPNLAQRLAAAKPDIGIPITPEDGQPVVLDGEVMPEEPLRDNAVTPAHWTDEPPEDHFPGTPAFNEGLNAAKDGISARECPYEQGTEAANDWTGAWHGYQKAQS